jgi:hypothetical protein
MIPSFPHDLKIRPPLDLGGQIQERSNQPFSPRALPDFPGAESSDDCDCDSDRLNHVLPAQRSWSRLTAR